MSSMDVSEESEVSKKSFKYKEQVFGHLNVTYSESNSLIIFWNKYQIFVHEVLNLENPMKIIVPEFQIKQVTAAGNYLICLDCSGNIHLTSMKFKNSTQKRFRSCFQPKDQGVLYCVKYSTDFILSLKKDLQTYFLCLNKISAEFQLEKKVKLQFEAEDWPLQDSTEKGLILKSFSLDKEEFTQVKGLFKEDALWREHSLILISFDKISIFACLITNKDCNEASELVKVCSCPTKLCDFEIIDRKTLIAGLTTGTILKMPLQKILKKPEINVIHLNTALSKFIVMKSDSLIYTDGVTIWRSENSYSKDSIKFSQLFAKNIKDFVKYGDQLICITYSSTIYTFSIDNKANYLKSDDNAYCPAEKLLSNSDYLQRITQEINKNNEVINRINEEENFITAMSLSKRQDLMDTVVHQKIVVYENYQDIKETTEITLTEDLEEYFRTESLLLLIKFTTSTVHHALSNILTNLLGDLTIHVTFISAEKVLKTTSLKLGNILKNLDILIPLNCKNVTKLNVETKFVCQMPGVLDKSQVIWVPLYKKVAILNAEHFIRVNQEKKDINLKEPQKSIDELIQKVTENQHGDLIKITDVSKTITRKDCLVFYIKLPENYGEKFDNEKYYNDRLNPAKAMMIKKQINAELFLKSRSSVYFEIGTEKVHLKIINNDFFNPLLEIPSKDGQIALDIRNFFANLMYDNLNGCETGKEFVSNSLYTTTENLQKALKNIDGRSEETLTLSEEFQKNVIGALPI